MQTKAMIAGKPGDHGLRLEIEPIEALLNDRLLEFEAGAIASKEIVTPL
jgi:hypothetical protein